MNTNPHISMADRQVAAATALLAKADAETRDLSPDEQRSYDDLMASANAATKRAGEYRDVMAAMAPFGGTPAAGTPEFRSVVPPNRALTPAPRAAAPRTTAIERRSANTSRETAILVPSLAEYRQQAEGSDPAGGFLVPVEQAPIVVERLAPESVFLSANPRMFNMHSDEMRMPMIGTGATVAWVLENQPIPESAIVFAAAALVARKLAGRVRASNEWLSDAIPDARAVVEQNLLTEIAINLDNAFFNGTGIAPEILGVLNWPGVTKTAGAASLDDIAAAIARVEAANATPDAIFVSPANWSAIRLERVDGVTGGYHLQPDASEAARPVIFGVRVFVTPHVGTSIVVADMSSIAVGARDQWNVFFDPYRYSEYDQSAIRVTSRWAIAPLHVEGVEIITTGGVAVREGREDNRPAATGAAKAILERAEAAKK